MKAVVAIVTLALGVVIGVTAGMVIREPESIFDTRALRELLPSGTPDSCLQVVDAAEEMSRINADYLSLLRDTYVPLVERQAEPGPGTGTDGDPPAASGVPVVGGMLAANEQLVDLSERTTIATAKLSEAKTECRSQARP